MKIVNIQIHLKAGVTLNEKENVKQVFSKNKEAYVSSSTHAGGNDLPLMIEWLKPNSEQIALDIATGGGHAAKYLSEHVKKVIATDITEAMLLHTKQHLRLYRNISYAVADAENLPYPNESFDMVTCRIAAHHFPHPALFISEVQRVLKPNGKFLFIDNVAAEDTRLDQFINTLEKMRDYSHVRSLKVSEWKQLFQVSNITITKENLRKKVLPYDEWINRTLETKEACEKVGSYMLNTKKHIQDYHLVKIQDKKIHSFAIDEWMVLATK